MHLNGIKRMSLAAGLLACAAFSSAYSFTALEQGSYSLTATGFDSLFNITSIFSSDSPLPTAGELVLTESTISIGTPAPITGTLSLTGPSSGDSLMFTFTGTAVTNTDFSQSISALLTETSTTGAFNVLSSFTGNLAAQLFIAAGSREQTGIISVSAQAVPEPASLAVIGLGTLGIFARKRRA